jgi:hypothetical protein
MRARMWTVAEGEAVKEEEEGGKSAPEHMRRWRRRVKRRASTTRSQRIGSASARAKELVGGGGRVAWMRRISANKLGRSVNGPETSSHGPGRRPRSRPPPLPPPPPRTSSSNSSRKSVASASKANSSGTRCMFSFPPSCPPSFPPSLSPSLPPRHPSEARRRRGPNQKARPASKRPRRAFSSDFKCKFKRVKASSWTEGEARGRRAERRGN